MASEELHRPTSWVDYGGVAVEQQRADAGGGTDVLLERDVEMGLIADLVRDAAQGRGGLLLFTALPGLGKSALLDHGVRVAQDAGLLVLRARGHQLEQAFGWGVGRSLFEANCSVGRHSSVNSPTAARRRLRQPVTTLPRHKTQHEQAWSKHRHPADPSRTSADRTGGCHDPRHRSHRHRRQRSGS
jgi:hypothetical protein